MFWKCFNYNVTRGTNRANANNLAVNTTTTTGGSIELVLLEDDNNFDLFSNTLEDLFAHEETQLRKRVRVEDIEDKDDQVKFVNTSSIPITNSTTTTVAALNIMKVTKRSARPKKL